MKYVGILVITILILSAFTSTLQASDVIPQNNQKPASKETYSRLVQLNAKRTDIQEHKITTIELEKLRSQVGVYREGRNYNQIVNGHGTGFSPPTEKEWASIAQNAYFIDNIASTSSPASVDLSATPWFPPIGNQANQGSCVAWSIGYYVKTFQEAKEHSWDLSGATWEGGYSGHPSPSYQDKIMSPAFIYNLINDGQDGGASYSEAIKLVCFIGESSWAKMPYNRLNYTVWPSEPAWTEAPNYRGNSSGYQYMSISDNPGISNIKNWLASGNLAVISVDAYKIQNQVTGVSLLTDMDMLTLDNYVNPSTNHAATIVGYDDNVSYTELGATKYGAFKIANSWGKGDWEKISDGFYWISYEAMKQRVSQGGSAMFYFDSNNYQPSLLAKFAIQHTKRSECTITVGLGTPTSPIITKIFSNYVSGGDLAFCANNIVIDITDFKKIIPVFNEQPFFLKVIDAGTSTIGNITYFGIDSLVASGIPCQTKQSQNVFVNLTFSTTSFLISPSTGPPSGTITFDGAGFSGSSTNISFLNPVNNSWISIINNLPITSGNFTHICNAPDLFANNAAGDNQPRFDKIYFKAIDNNSRSFNASVQYSEGRRGLAQISNTVATGLFGNNSNLASNVFVQNGQSLAFSGSWFKPGNATLLWDDTISLGNAIIDGTGFFNATIQVPITPAGQHKLTINDGNAAFCVNLTRLPVVDNDYVDGWYTSDITINLIPDYSMNETFYRINSGSVCNLTSSGQPTITTEGNNNTLEYWSTWNVCETGINETLHVTVTEIKLDKTAPIGAITTEESTTRTPTITLVLSAVDAASGTIQMRFSNDNTIWSDWELFVSSKTWVLQSGDDQKTVTVQFMDNAGLSSTYSYILNPKTPQPTTTLTPTPSPAPTALLSQTRSPDPNPTSTPTASPTPTNSQIPTSMTVPEAPEEVLILIILSTLMLALLFRKKEKTRIPVRFCKSFC